MLGKGKYEVELLSHLLVHKGHWEESHVFSLSTAVLHTFTMLSKVCVFSDVVSAQRLLRDALYCPLLCYVSTLKKTLLPLLLYFR